MTFLMHKGVAGATATRAYSGFGEHHRLHTPKIEVLAEHLPIRIEFVEAAEKVEEVLPSLYEMVTDGLIEVQDTTVVKLARPACRSEPVPPHERRRGRRSCFGYFWARRTMARRAALRCDCEEAADDGYRRRHGVSRNSGYGAKGHEHKRSFWHPMRDLPVRFR